MITTQQIIVNDNKYLGSYDISKHGQYVLHQGEKFSYFKSGISRYAFQNETQTKVVKLPKNQFLETYKEVLHRLENDKRLYGYELNHNIIEAAIYAKCPAAHRRFLAKTTIDEFFVVEQEFVEVYSMTVITRNYNEKTNSIVSASLREIGLNKDGYLVIFDFDTFMPLTDIQAWTTSFIESLFEIIEEQFREYYPNVPFQSHFKT